MNKTNTYYDIVFVTNLPSFYKLKLYNEISKKKKIFVIFFDKMEASRNSDFCKGERLFDYVILSDIKSPLRYFKYFKFILSGNYKKIIYSGWDNILTFISAYLSPKRKNGICIESAPFISKTGGIKALIKRILLAKISFAVLPGKSNFKLMELLKFKGRYIKTYGVGLFNLLEQAPYEERKEVKNFLFVGRYIWIKNLPLLLSAFAERPNLCLNMVGFGELEDELKKTATPNVIFHGAIDNKDLPNVYKQNDVLMLTSFSECWGLVVEEAMNNGSPVIVSDHVGCAEEIIKDKGVGLVFKNDDKQSLLDAIDSICNIDTYNQMRKTISEQNPQETERLQIQAYLDL